MKKFSIYIFLFFLTSGSVAAQPQHLNKNDVLSGLFSRIVSNSDDETRQLTNDSLRTFIKNYAGSDTVFNFTYDAKFLGQITSPDSLVKIITWNLLLESGRNRYFSYIIHRDENDNKNKNKVYELTAEYTGKTIFSDTTYHTSDWYGALYYSIRPFPDDTVKSWVILGLDFGNSDVSRKVIDVLSFPDDKSPLFGRKWFETQSGPKFRQVFEYSSMGTMTLRFMSDTSIVFDHLVPVSASSETGRLYYGPDYSYDSFVFSNDRWKFKVNVDARNKE